ncbi:amidohydrolase family protein [uncultured Pseudoteredinibacter sp.]|uniref:amidohydrolase family protein n=1 Tax=uncultured Pseudoteredinibacter sp. TaxID=1641701 RepID=UPI0026152F99|nr:amidohydrolase family protein [uncultured Pseudoteredinibacter sp.]
MSEKIIDVWMQHPNLEFSNHEMFASLRRWNKTDILTEAIPLDWTLAAMDQAGVDKSLACAWSSPNGYLISNEEVADIVQKAPDRFVGVAGANLAKPMEAVRELRKWVSEYGFKALRIVQWVWNLPPTDPLYYPLYAECVNLGVPICLQVGHTGPLRPSETGRPIPYIDQIALDFPELQIVGGHVGYPWTTEMIAVATKHENVFIDTSAYSANRFPPELIQFMKSNGRKKVMFGTNYPMITPEKCLRDLDSLGMDEESRALFLSGNAERVFKL